MFSGDYTGMFVKDITGQLKKLSQIDKATLVLLQYLIEINFCIWAVSETDEL